MALSRGTTAGAIGVPQQNEIRSGVAKLEIINHTAKTIAKISYTE
jgi:hypothetical protein